MKGVTPVIALVMLMLITVGIVGASATWFSGTFTSQTKKFVFLRRYEKLYGRLLEI
ncbi:MAG: hypothetical protein HYT71_02740 [Candidatus Aenigmarchaeota archaeon]|nr:hypothetical protein [Candidatus Aenigmarchaeota archaeon]